MKEIQGSDITFTVHPRPETDDVRSPSDPLPLPAHPASVPSITGAEDVSGHGDTFLGDLVFLARFAFGRY